MYAAAPLAIEVGPGQAGPLGLLIVLLLCGACALLFRSMKRRIYRVQQRFPVAPPAGGPPAGEAPVPPPDGRADG